MRKLLLAASLLACAAAASTASAETGAIRLVPHRVVYDLSLAKAGGGRGVESARGRIVFDFTGDDCDGYALNYRQVTVLESSESGTKTSDLRTTTFESGDGRSLRFKTQSQADSGAPQLLDGTAERDRSLQIRLKQPKLDMVNLDGEAIFPTAHMKRLIEAARAGTSTVSVKVFDGSDDGRKVYDTLAVIGRRIGADSVQGVEAPLRQGEMAAQARWPVTLSYFAPGQGERTPTYVLSFDLYENGVSRGLRLDYGEFALNGELTSIELLPPSACQR